MKYKYEEFNSDLKGFKDKFMKMEKENNDNKNYYFLIISLIDYHFLKYKQSTIEFAWGYIFAKFFNSNWIYLILNNTIPKVNHAEVKDCAKHLLLLVKFFIREFSFK